MVIVIGGGAAVTATGPTLLTLQNALAAEFFYLGTQVSTEATQGETTRVVMADELRDDESGYMIPGAMWLYARGSPVGSQRRIVTGPGGHLSSAGAVTLSRPLSASLDAATNIDVTGPLPMKQVGTVKGYATCINEGLARVWIEARLSFTGNGTRAYSLASYPWLTSESQIRGIYDTSQSVDGVADASPQVTRFQVNNVTRSLIIEQSYAADTTFQVAVIVRADRLVYDGSSWSYVTTPGLLNDSYQTAAPQEWAVQFGLWRACRFLRMWLPHLRMDPEQRAALLATVNDRYTAAVRACTRIKLEEFPSAVAQPRQLMVTASMPVPWP